MPSASSMVAVRLSRGMVSSFGGKRKVKSQELPLRITGEKHQKYKHELQIKCKTLQKLFKK